MLMRVQFSAPMLSSKDSPWCLFDTYHRHMERRYLNFDFATGKRIAELERLVNRARQRYSEVGSSLAERFLVSSTLQIPH